MIDTKEKIIKSDWLTGQKRVYATCKSPIMHPIDRFTWRHGGHICVFKNFLLFQAICKAADHVTENDLFAPQNFA